MTGPALESAAEWGSLPDVLRLDPVWKSEAFRLASSVQPAAWSDCEALARHAVTRQVAPQVYRAVASIAANIAEGFSRSSGRDRARLYEYALGSAREAIVWYRSAIPVIGEDVAIQRQIALQSIVRLLLASIPRERRRKQL